MAQNVGKKFVTAVVIIMVVLFGGLVLSGLYSNKKSIEKSEANEAKGIFGVGGKKKKPKRRKSKKY